ncbi:hypothetical protein [Dietzia sp. 179-F 9C3 NHS]|uniref:hypothetical protein n=1 Tax=Dietzia sp. 179-F 9C3 NHS TaxID=3374295 RepID=UPI0038792429
MAFVVVVAGIVTGLALTLGEKKDPGSCWELRSRKETRYVHRRSDGPGRRDETLDGDEAHLARHSAAALWALYAGRASRTWQSKQMVEWRARLDLRTEAADTIRTAGTLQDLRLALTQPMDSSDDDARSKWESDYAVYQAGMASLRSRVEQQVALRIAVEEIDRLPAAPTDARTELVDRVVAVIPGNEIASENLNEITYQSAELLSLYERPTPPLDTVDGHELGAAPGQKSGH